MLRAAAIIVRGSSPVRFAGVDLSERAVRLARKAGVEQIRVVEDVRPLVVLPLASTVLVIPERVIVEPALVRHLLERGLGPDEDAAVLIDRDGRASGVVLMSLAAMSRVRWAPRLHSAIRRLAVEAHVGTVSCGSRFCVELRDARALPALEQAYMTVTNGADGEGYFTRNIRRFSIPVSRWLVRRGTSANQVTIAGFVLAIASGLAFAMGGYGFGIAGALLYWASMVLDCSDGEVARATLTESKYGAWLETITDYLSYFAVLAGIVYGDVRTEGLCKHAVSAMVAAASSFSIVTLVGYLRARVASENPGGFDDALVADLSQGTTVQRFAVWGRQLIKRAFVAHLILFQAFIGQLPALTEIWAVGSVAALIVVLSVHTHIIRTVRPAPIAPAVTA